MIVRSFVFSSLAAFAIRFLIVYISDVQLRQYVDMALIPKTGIIHCIPTGYHMVYPIGYALGDPMGYVTDYYLGHLMC